MLVLTVLIVFAVGGMWSSVSFTHSDSTRAGNVSVVGAEDPNAVVGIIPATSIDTGSDNQDFTTLHNHLGSSATLTVEITTEDAKDNVTFVSTSSVTVSGDGTTATVDLNNDNSITLLVDVDSNVSSSVDTVDFVVSGGANDGRVSVDINEQTGPTVNKN